MPPPDGSPVEPMARTLTGTRPPRREDRAAHRTMAGPIGDAARARAPPRAGSAPATATPRPATAGARGEHGDRHGDVAEQDAAEGTAQEHARGARAGRSPARSGSSMCSPRRRLPRAATDLRPPGGRRRRSRPPPRRPPARRMPSVRWGARSADVASRHGIGQLGLARRAQAACARAGARVPPAPAQRQARGARVERPGRRHAPLRASARTAWRSVGQCSKPRAAAATASAGHARQQREREQRRRGAGAGHGLHAPSPTAPTTARPGARSRSRSATATSPAPSASEAGSARPIARAQRAEHCTRAAPATPRTPSSATPATSPAARRRVDAAAVPGEARRAPRRRRRRRRPRRRTGRARAGAPPGPAAPQRRAEQEGHVGRGEDDGALPRPPARDRDEGDERDGRAPLGAPWRASATEPRAELAVP